MPAALDNWTVDMLDALPNDGQRYEIIDGVLHVTPAPAEVHQLVLGEFYVRFHAYLRGTSVGRPVFSPSDVRKDDRRRNRVQPDLCVVRLRDGRRPPYPYAISDLLLAIEVESPSDPLYDYQTKRKLYLSHGVPESWVVNPVAQLVSRFQSLEDLGTVFGASIQWHPCGIAKPLIIDLPALFDAALS